eukprot:13175461-Alexandrium_andersonii.AAC.1
MPALVTMSCPATGSVSGARKAPTTRLRRVSWLRWSRTRTRACSSWMRVEAAHLTPGDVAVRGAQ